MKCKMLEDKFWAPKAAKKKEFKEDEARIERKQKLLIPVKPQEILAYLMNAE